MAACFIDVPIENRINAFFDKVVASANLRRSSLLDQVNEKRREMASRTEKEQELIESKAYIERTVKHIESQQRLLAEIENQLAEVRVPETRLVFQGDYEQLDQLMSGLGEVLEEEMPPAIPQYDQLRQVVEVGKRGRNPGELSYPSGVAIDPNSNHIYVAEYRPARVSVFSESGEFLNTLTHEPMMEPWGIAIHRDNVYVTDRIIHGVFHFKKYTGIHFIARLTGEGSADGQFDDPRQLSVSVNGDVYVADWGNHRIQILDDFLSFERSITHESIRFPIDVQLTHNEVYVLCPIDSPYVHVFSHDGEQIRSFITCGTGMQITTALVFCLDDQENLIISDWLDHSVKVFSPDGTLMYTIKGVSAPRGVAVTKLTFIVITPDETSNLKIYSC